MEKEGIPLVRLPVAAKGFLCGSLLAGSVAIPYGLPVQVLMLTLSIIMFLESIFAFGRSRSTLSFSAAMVVGMIALAAVALIRVIAEYLAVIFLAVAAIYISEFLAYRKARQPA